MKKRFWDITAAQQAIMKMQEYNKDLINIFNMKYYMVFSIDVL